MTNPHEHWCRWSSLYKMLGCVLLISTMVVGLWTTSGRWHIRQVEAALLPDTVRAISARVEGIQEDVDLIEEWITRADARWVWQACVSVAAPGYLCDQWLSWEDRERLRRMREDAGRRDGDDS